MGTLQENIIYNNIKQLCDNSVPRVSFSKMCVDRVLGTDQKEKAPASAEAYINGDPELTEYLEEC